MVSVNRVIIKKVAKLFSYKGLGKKPLPIVEGDLRVRDR